MGLVVKGGIVHSSILLVDYLRRGTSYRATNNCIAVEESIIGSTG